MKFKPDMSESGNEPVADGVYSLVVSGNPTIRLSKGEKTTGLAYVTFQLNLTGGASGPPIFERVFISGKQAWRFAALCKALGLSDAEVKTMDIEAAGEVTAEKDVECKLLVGGTAWNPNGKIITVILSTEEGRGEYGPRNRIKKFAA